MLVCCRPESLALVHGWGVLKPLLLLLLLLLLRKVGLKPLLLLILLLMLLSVVLKLAALGGRWGMVTHAIGKGSMYL
jgi:hypothetical protein